MPGLVRAGRKRPSLAVLDDDSDSDPASFTPGNKRRRYPDASNSPTTTENHDDGADSLLTDDAAFHPGSIIRVKLKNFVTYTAAEFHLGPSLNMIIGPNGTGKSTLVCAICLGLGWSSEHLGRSKELSAFVKHGAAEAEIEIELAKSERMAKNPIIKRTIRKEDNKTVFWLNNKHTPKSAILELARGLNIQIDNLCQFLPQDRVVEFAKMTDQNRLVETQRAAAPPYMIEWHSQLKELRKQEKALEIEQGTQQTDLAKLERLQNSTRGDVERFNQRQELVTKAKALERVRPIIEIQLRKHEVSQVKTDLREARIELDKLNGEVEPVRQAQDEVEAYRSQLDQAVKLRKNRVEMAKTQADKLISRIENEKQTVAGYTAEARAEGGSKKTREQDIVRANGQIASLERQRQERPVDYNPEDYQERQNELRGHFSAANRRMTEVDATMAELKARSGPIIQRRNDIKVQLEQLSTQSGKQANLLARVSRDTATAWKWFQEHKHGLSLRGEVYGPPILTCTIPDTQYVQPIESQMRKGDVIGITCTNGEDQKLLMEKFTGRENLGLHDIFLRTSPKPLSSYQDPVKREDLGRFGFESYLVDHIQGPDAVIAMLCDNVRLNRIAFAPTPISNQQHEATVKSQIQTFVSGRETYKITTRREYGASSTSVTPLRKAQYFTDQPANTEEKRVLDDKMKQNQQESQQLQDQLNEMKNEKNGLQEQINDARQQRVGFPLLNTNARLNLRRTLSKKRRLACAKLSPNGKPYLAEFVRMPVI
jgi:chromosome segregation ATPase